MIEPCVKINLSTIYNKLLDIENHVIETNGKVKINRLIGRLSLGLSLALITTLAGIKLGGLI